MSAKLGGDGNAGVVVAYAAAGLCIAAVSGMEAAFRTESRAANLRALAAYCQTTLWQIDTEWRKSVAIESTDADKSPESSRVSAAKLLLDRQDQVLGDVQSKAAEFGENITFQVRRLYGTEVPAAA